MNDYKIKELYEEMEMELIRSMKRNLNRHLNEEVKTGFQYPQWQAEKLRELSRYRKQNKEIIGEYTNNMDKEIAKQLQEEVKQGSINAIKQYNKALGKNLKPSKLMNKSFFKTNDRKVDALIKMVNNDLKTANSSALRMINDQYRQVIHKSAFFVGNGVFTEQQATRMATEELSELKKAELAIDEANKSFLAGGLNCIEYKNGRRVNIASYSQMAVRTANLRAQLMGEGNFRKSIGRTLVQATSHGGACPVCQKWEKHIFIDDVYSGGIKKDGKYMLLSEAMKQGFLHPNCRHGLTTYYPELEDIENESDEKYQADWNYINERINYIARNVKKYDRLSKGSINQENISFYSNKKNQLKKERNLIIRNNKVDNIVKLIDVANEEQKRCNELYNLYKENNVENLSLIDSKNYKLKGKITNLGQYSTVAFSKEQLSIMNESSKRSLIAIHNHPNNSTFSLKDIRTCLEYDSLNGIIVVTNDYVYVLKPKFYKTSFNLEELKEFDVWLENSLAKERDYIDSKFMYPDLSNNDLLHITYKKVFDKLGWKYGRAKRR